VRTRPGQEGSIVYTVIESELEIKASFGLRFIRGVVCKSRERQRYPELLTCARQTCCVAHSWKRMPQFGSGQVAYHHPVGVVWGFRWLFSWKRSHDQLVNYSLSVTRVLCVRWCLRVSGGSGLLAGLLLEGTECEWTNGKMRGLLLRFQVCDASFRRAQRGVSNSKHREFVHSTMVVRSNR
jgi:hypothetical protein